MTENRHNGVADPIRQAECAQISQEDLASTLNIAPSYLSEIEHGRTSKLLTLTIKLLRRLGAEITVTFPPASPDDNDGT